MLVSARVITTPPERRADADPDLVAHRGWAARFPENTRSALEAAVGAGARFLEVDVQVSADGHPVLFHDRTLHRLCGVPGSVHERTLDDLASLSCAERDRFGDRFAGERIAGLRDLTSLLEAHPDVFAFVEIKRLPIEILGSAAVLDRVLPVLEPVRSRVALISFSLPFLVHARGRTSLPLGAVFDLLSDRELRPARELAPEFVFCDVDGLPAAGPLDAQGSRLAVYEVADPGLARALAARGVEFVETFAIGEMLAAQRERRALHS
ncbi:MAG: glycerophosphodiester phosphodiesterase family protein [Planctomycetota bacterium]